MTKLDDLRDYLKNKNKPKDDARRLSTASTEKQDFSLEVGGGGDENPIASFGGEEQDQNMIDMLYSKARHKPNMGEGVYWDQDY